MTLLFRECSSRWKVASHDIERDPVILFLREETMCVINKIERIQKGLEESQSQIEKLAVGPSENDLK